MLISYRDVILLAMISYFKRFLGSGEEKRLILKNGAWRFASSVVGRLMRFVVFLLAARWLGPDSFGEYSYALSLATLAFIFSDWGINILLIRDVHQGINEKKVLSNALVAKILVNIVSSVAALILFSIVDNGQYFVLGIFISGILFISNIKEVYMNFFIAREKTYYEFIVSSVELILNLLLLVGLYMFSYLGAMSFVLFNLGISIILLIVSIGIASKKLFVKYEKISNGYVKRLLVSGFPLALFGISGYIFFSSDQLFIKYFIGVEAVGYYSLATRTMYALMIIPSVLVSVALPLMSRLVLSDTKKLRRIVNKGILCLGGIGLLGCLGILIFGKSIVLAIVPEYFLAVDLMKVMSIALPAMFITLLLDNVLFTFNKQKEDFYITICAAVINLILNFILIPRFGLHGALYATIIAQVLNLIATYLYTLILFKKSNIYGNT